MAKKKQKRIPLSRADILLIAFILLMGSALLNNLTNNMPHNYCKQNPDKCVCEEWECPNSKGCVCACFCDDNNIDCGVNRSHIVCPEHCGDCLKQRKLTPAELQAKDCNDNPREDDKCKCIKTKDTNNEIRGYACPNSCHSITIKKCKVYGLYHYNEELDIEGTVLYNNYCEFNSYFEDITEGRNITMEIIEENITSCEQCYEYEQVCISAIPKTECEKGNKDFILMNYKHLEQGYIIVNNEKYYKDSNGFICRPKTKDEKLLDEDCNSLFIVWSNNYDCRENNYAYDFVYKGCHNNYVKYLRAWKQKGCTI